eukprot:155267-Prymnesium_polylepis.1
MLITVRTLLHLVFVCLGHAKLPSYVALDAPRHHRRLSRVLRAVACLVLVQVQAAELGEGNARLPR